MKGDGRTLDHKTLEEIRLMAVERVRNGEPASEVIAACGFDRTTIYRWLTAAKKPGVGIKALRSRKATGRPRSLTAAQEREVFRWINGRDPNRRTWARRGHTPVIKIAEPHGRISTIGAIHHTYAAMNPVLAVVARSSRSAAGRLALHRRFTEGCEWRALRETRPVNIPLRWAWSWMLTVKSSAQ